ncbi:MAG: hypothetical protein WDO68_05390 [Gammaproteobacteria bacterium]
MNDPIDAIFIDTRPAGRKAGCCCGSVNEGVSELFFLPVEFHGLQSKALGSASVPNVFGLDAA